MFVALGFIIAGIVVILTVIAVAKGKRNASCYQLMLTLVFNAILVVILCGAFLAREQSRYEPKDLGVACQARHRGSVFGWTYSDGEEKDFVPFGPLERSVAKVLCSEEVEAKPHLIAGGSIVCQALVHDTVVGWFEKGSDRRMVPYCLPYTFFHSGKNELNVQREAYLKIGCFENGFGKGQRYLIEIKSKR